LIQSTEEPFKPNMEPVQMLTIDGKKYIIWGTPLSSMPQETQDKILAVEKEVLEKNKAEKV